jgi:hypothetical protein
MSARTRLTSPHFTSLRLSFPRFQFIIRQSKVIVIIVVPSINMRCLCPTSKSILSYPPTFPRPALSSFILQYHSWCLTQAHTFPSFFPSSSSSTCLNHIHYPSLPYHPTIKSKDASLYSHNPNVTSLPLTSTQRKRNEKKENTQGDKKKKKKEENE